MEESLITLVKENTKKGREENNTAFLLGNALGLSRNTVSQYLNDIFNQGLFIKINTRPVLFLDKEELEKKYHIHFHIFIFSSLDELKNYIENGGKKDFQNLIGYSGSLRKIVESCKASISYPSHGLPILLNGPTGTGKSFIIEKMFEYGKNNNILKKDAKFIHVNCSEYANNPELITANLFGYKKGAFTGADSDNPGLIKVADGGILFLDEVHCLKPECQEKLFLFMDKGSYHVLGDSENEHHSHVFLAFATTENPKEVLLKTLLRRIPIQIEIPSLAKRSESEKSNIIVQFLENESQQIKKEIRISNVVYSILLNNEYEGNIGELKNIIQETCMNALYANRDKDYIEINFLCLPSRIRFNNHVDNAVLIGRNQIYSLNDLKNKYKNEFPFKEYCDKLLMFYHSYEKNEISLSILYENVLNETQNYANDSLFRKNKEKSLDIAYFTNIMKKITELVNSKYKCDFQLSEILSLSLLIHDYYTYYVIVEGYFEIHHDEFQKFNNLIKSNYCRSYEIARYLNELCSIYVDLNLHIYLTLIFTLFIESYHGNRILNQTVGVILSHGYATASSIADAVNRMLDAYVFDAIDMPLDTSTELIINKLNVFIESYGGNIKNLILLVDMGSLEEIYNGLMNVSKANIAIANNVNTRFALYIGEEIIQKKSLKEIFEKSTEYNQTNYKIIESKEKEKVILCSCATGIGTAEKLKEIIEDSLPLHLPVKVITYDYNSLLEIDLEEELLNDYDIICVIGTLNPKLKNLHFIPIEELIMNNSLDFLTSYFADIISQEDMDLFQKKMLKNFSLTNIIGNLTILNPKQLLERVADAINLLQKEMSTTFSNSICFGLYVHICCLIERLVTREGMDFYQKDLSDCNADFTKFYMKVKKSFKQVEKYYRVEIPIEEVEFINIYIQNMMVIPFNEFEGMEE